MRNTSVHCCSSTSFQPRGEKCLGIWDTGTLVIQLELRTKRVCRHGDIDCPRWMKKLGHPWDISVPEKPEFWLIFGPVVSGICVFSLVK